MVKVSCKLENLLYYLCIQGYKKNRLDITPKEIKISTKVHTGSQQKIEIKVLQLND